MADHHRIRGLRQFHTEYRERQTVDDRFGKAQDLGIRHRTDLRAAQHVGQTCEADVHLIRRHGKQESADHPRRDACGQRQQSEENADRTGIYLARRSRLVNRQQMLMYGKEASNRKQEIDRQHYTIPNQRPKDKHCGKI